MPYVVQAKGLQHCKNMKKEAWELWCCASHLNTFEQVLARVIEDHRRLVEDEMRMKMREKQETADHECL